jgi:hypothetical protein
LVKGHIKLSIFSPDDNEKGKERILEPGEAFGDFSDVDPSNGWEKLYIKTTETGAEVII